MLVPLRDADGVLRNYQRINNDGRKRFAAGGRVRGCFCTIGNLDGATRALLAEGYATAATLHKATGLPTVMAVDCGNLEHVAAALAAKHPNIEWMICADDDRDTKGNPGVAHAVEAAKRFKLRVAIPHGFADDSTGTDYNDLGAERGVDEIKRQVATAWNTKPLKFTLAEVAPDLEKLTPDRLSEEASKWAEYFGMTARDIKSAAKKQHEDDEFAKPSVKVDAAKTEPWPDKVAGAQLLADIEKHLCRFVILDAHARVACPLWCVFTHAVEAFEYAPILRAFSATKRCGKSILKRTMAPIVARPLTTSNISPAALFRVIDARKPTPLIDELDSLPDGDQKQALTNLLNGGFCKHDSAVIRCDGDKHELREFNVYGPKFVAAIGQLGDTVEDRSIRITMRRKSPHEKVERIRDRHTDPSLARRAAKWASDNLDRLATASPIIPDELNDRQADIWEPLFAIADLCGREWPQRTRSAALGRR